MSVWAPAGCIMCHREVAKNQKVLYMTLGRIASTFLDAFSKQRVSSIQRTGGKIKQRGYICQECAEKVLPEQLRFEP